MKWKPEHSDLHPQTPYKEFTGLRPLTKSDRMFTLQWPQQGKSQTDITMAFRQNESWFNSQMVQWLPPVEDITMFVLWGQLSIRLPKIDWSGSNESYSLWQIQENNVIMCFNSLINKRSPQGCLQGIKFQWSKCNWCWNGGVDLGIPIKCWSFCPNENGMGVCLKGTSRVKNLTPHTDRNLWSNGGILGRSLSKPYMCVKGMVWMEWVYVLTERLIEVGHLHPITLDDIGLLYTYLSGNGVDTGGELFNFREIVPKYLPMNSTYY